MSVSPADCDQELITFEDETASKALSGSLAPWRILIVDDDEDVHASTLYALNNVRILGRQLEFLHAYSSADAGALLAIEKNIAVILLDVVMERDDAGLVLVHHIRHDLGLAEVRIILRTGQPGYAPEIAAVRDYDINDYRTKSELTRSKLYTAMTASIRSYEQILAINAARRGLDLIVRGSAELIRLQGIKAFASGVIMQLSGLLGLSIESLVCAQETPSSDGRGTYRVVAAAGHYVDQIDRSIDELPNNRIRTALSDTLRQRSNLFEAEFTTLYFHSPSGRDMAVFLDTPVFPHATDRQLLEVFCSNCAMCLDNVALVTRLRHQAYFDALVPLPNRTHFIEAIDNHVAEAGCGGRLVMLVDIDHFAEVNDALGHLYGDQLLKSVSARLRSSLPASVFLARVSGDAFGVFGLEEELDPGCLLELLTRPFELDGASQTVSATLGLVRLTDVDGSGLDALKAASIALKRAKQSQRGHFAYFTRDMGVEIRARVKLLEDLRSAFAQDHLFLNYQPQVCLSDGHLIGLEALIRWRGNDGRMVPPDRFIPLAEQCGLIIAIGEWVMRTACRQQRKLADGGRGGVRMAINVSVVQFRSPRFLDMLDAALADSGADPRCIELEITESVAMLEADHMVGMFTAIKRRGLQIAVDDFGTGFSSLSYLRQLAIDRLKIDRAFVSQMGEGSSKGEGRSIAAMVVDLGSNLGLQVIAEGVEDEVQAGQLREMGCHEAQGFHYGRPMDESGLDEWLVRHDERFRRVP